MMEYKNLKSGVNFERQQRKDQTKKLEKVKWFDNLNPFEKQRLYNSYKGCKRNIVFINDCDKIIIHNKILNPKF